MLPHPQSASGQAGRIWQEQAKLRHWLVVLKLALGAAPLQALQAMVWLIIGKRMRGWNLLNLAAAAHPDYYLRWIEHAEPQIIQNYCNLSGARAPLARVGCLILADGEHERGAAQRSLASLRAALGPAGPIWSNLPDLSAVLPVGGQGFEGLAAALAAMARQHPVDWLLPIRAGDLVNSVLGSALGPALNRATADTLVYWDEDSLIGGKRHDPWLKPEWDELVFLARDGLCGAGLLPLEPLRSAAAAAAMQDATLRPEDLSRLVMALVAEPALPPKLHIPLVLAHRQAGRAFQTAAQRHALIGLARPDLAAVPGGDPAFPFVAIGQADPARWPKVSIIIPTRDRPELLEACMAGLRRLEYPGAIEILVVDNDSCEEQTLALFGQYRRDGIARILRHPGAFNFAAMINQAARVANGECLCLLNNDVEALDGVWLSRMVAFAVRPEFGAIGCQLLYPDRTIQHAGVTIGIGGAAGHIQKGARPGAGLFASWHQLTRQVAAVTAACLVVETQKFSAVGGMDEAAFPVDFNDVDFCQKLAAQGLSNVYVAQARLVHHESKSRGAANTAAESPRFACELQTLRSRWGTATRTDPMHSPLFLKSAERCLLVF